MIGRRTLLLGLAALMCAAALFAIAVLIVGRFGPTEARILATTGLLAAAGLLALPAVLLVEQARNRQVARLNALLAAVAGAVGTAAVWGQTDTLARAAGSAYVLAAGAAQAAGLLARSNAEDPPVVQRVFVASLATDAALAALIVTLIWSQVDSTAYARALGSVAVLDVLLVGLQPLLARIRPVSHHYQLWLMRTDGVATVRELDAVDHASAAARAIRDEERLGRRIRAVRFKDEQTPTR